MAGTVKSNDRIRSFATSREILAALGTDGYAIEVAVEEKEIHILGQSDSGVVAAVGRLMREMRYHQGSGQVTFFPIARGVDALAGVDRVK